MVNRTLAMVVMLCAIGFAWSYTSAQTGKSATTNGDIAALQQQRIELLKERVSKMHEYHEAELVDRTDVIGSQVDLILAAALWKRLS